MGHEVFESDESEKGLDKSTLVPGLHTKHVYSKDFLLSIAELEDCKRAPAGLDTALLRDAQKVADRGVAIPEATSRGLIHPNTENDAQSPSPPDLPEWRRPSSLPGSPFLKHGPRQAEPNISSPRLGTVRVGSNPARTIMGRSGSARWELRSNGADKEKEINCTHYDWESTSNESGARLRGKGVARMRLVSQEHDGLLGSGGPIVHKAVFQRSASDRLRVTERIGRTGRIGEQYHSNLGVKLTQNPGQPRHEDIDVVSDKTFGSEDLPNGERSEHERQRRDRFEQMREELRKKPLNTARDHTDDWFESLQNNESASSFSPGTPYSSSDVLKPYNKPVTSSSTPHLLVPPGFSKKVVQKPGSPKENTEAIKVENFQKEDTNVVKLTELNGVGKAEDFSAFLEVGTMKDKNDDASSQVQSPVMSKFARWFPTQGSNKNGIDLTISNQEPMMHLATTEGEDLDMQNNLSPSVASELAIGNKLRSVASLMPINSQGPIIPMPVGPSLEDVEKVMTADTDHVKAGHSNEEWMRDSNLVVDQGHEDRRGPYLGEKKTQTGVLTCEDLERSLLGGTGSVSSKQSELGAKEVQPDAEKSISLMHLLRGSVDKDTDNKAQQGWGIEQESVSRTSGSASSHIMSLLQKKATSSLTDAVSQVAPSTSDFFSGTDHVIEATRGRDTPTEILSLETLFGKGFVNELRSREQPVSSKQVLDTNVTQDGKESSKESGMIGHAGAGSFEETGWDYYSPPPERKEAEVSQETALQKDFWSQFMSPDHAHTKDLNRLSSPNGASVDESSFQQLEQLRHSLPHGGKSGYGQHDGRHLSPTTGPFHRVPFEPFQGPPFMQENVLYGGGVYPSNSHFHPFQGRSGFVRAGNHVSGHFEELSSVTPNNYNTMLSVFPAEYKEPAQMGFSPSHGVPDPRVGGSRIVDKWFAGQSSQSLAGFTAYQHPVPTMLQGVGKGFSRGPSADKRVQSDAVQLLHDPYMFQGRRG